MAKAEQTLFLSVVLFITTSHVVEVRVGELSAAMYRVMMMNELVIIKFSLVLLSCHIACSLLCCEMLLSAPYEGRSKSFAT